jgi:death on curing protein
MESLANNHPFIDGNQRVSFVMADARFRANGYFLDVDGVKAHKFITEAMERNEFRFPLIREWIASVTQPLADEEYRERKKHQSKKP